MHIFTSAHFLALLPALVCAMSVAPLLDLQSPPNATQGAEEGLENLVHPEEEGVLFEGDILLSPGQLSRSGILGNAYRWPNRIVYYQLAGIFASDAYRRNIVFQAMAQIQQRTCIRFEPVTAGQSAYVVITNRNQGCYSYVGRVGNAQELNLQVPGCDSVGTAMHELIHAIGFYHEQSRPDRDRYVIINWQNMDQRNAHNFRSLTNSLTYNIGYDYASVMHYTSYAFSYNRQPTIVARTPGVTLGGRVLTVKDAAKINSMYNCYY